MEEGFREKLKSNNGHIYMKVLRENIADELKLTEPVQVEDITLK